MKARLCLQCSKGLDEFSRIQSFNRERISLESWHRRFIQNKFASFFWNSISHHDLFSLWAFRIIILKKLSLNCSKKGNKYIKHENGCLESKETLTFRTCWVDVLFGRKDYIQFLCWNTSLWMHCRRASGMCTAQKISRRLHTSTLGIYD